MKHVTLIFVLFFIFMNMKSQTDIYMLKSVASDSYSLELRKDLFEIYFFKEKEFPASIDIRVQVMEGTTKKIGDIYELYDSLSSKKYYVRYINDEKFINIDLPNLLKDTLYSHDQRKTDYLVIGNWKNRKKDGVWIYISRKSGKIYKSETYKDGKLIKVTFPNRWTSKKDGE